MAMKKMLAKAKFKCVNFTKDVKGEECEWLTMQNIPAHLETCKYRKVKCEECPEVMKLNELKDHKVKEHSDICYEACPDCKAPLLLSETTKNSHKCIEYVIRIIKTAIGPEMFDDAIRKVNGKKRGKLDRSDLDNRGSSLLLPQRFDHDNKLYDSVESLREGAASGMTMNSKLPDGEKEAQDAVGTVMGKVTAEIETFKKEIGE